MDAVVMQLVRPVLTAVGIVGASSAATDKLRRPARQSSLGLVLVRRAPATDSATERIGMVEISNTAPTS